jgi:hypothetical protein
MPDNPEPNTQLIVALVAAQNAEQAYSILVDGGLSNVVLEVIEFLFELPDEIERAYMFDFIIRHGGLTMSNAKRCIGLQQTNKCGECGCVGHNKNHCPGPFPFDN